eukprot:2070780-Pleurochrysis_carterae.AAC.1
MLVLPITAWQPVVQRRLQSLRGQALRLAAPPAVAATVTTEATALTAAAVTTTTVEAVTSA